MANAVAMKNLDNLNNYVDEINKYIKDFEDGIITDFKEDIYSIKGKYYF